MTVQEIYWTTQSPYPILSMLQLVPIVAAITMIALRKTRFVIASALVFSAIEFAIAIDLLNRYDQGKSALQFVEHIDIFGVLSYHVGVNGIGVLFILLSSLLLFMLILYSRIRKLEPAGIFFAVMFGVIASVQNMFVTQNLLLFSIMSAVELLLVGYILARWASFSDDGQCLRRYFQFAVTGIVLLLVGALVMGWNYADAHNGAWSFNLHKLMSTPVKSEIQNIAFFLLFYGLAIRIPLFPLHGWLPMISEHGSVAVSGVFLLGIKTGVYGMMHFVMPLLSDAVKFWQNYIVTFAIIGVFYAAFLALMQSNLRRLLAYAVISHTSILIIGLFTLNHASFQGSVMLSVSFGLATSLLLFMAGLVYNRTRTMQLSRLGGLFDHLPIIGISFLIAGLSIIGMPGTPGFDAAHLILEASIVRFGALFTIAAALGNVLAAGFLLWAFQRAFLAPRHADLPELHIEKITPPELILAVTMIAVLLWAGFHSEPWLDLIENSVKVLEQPYLDQPHLPHNMPSKGTP